jgi:hypothetical protein
VRWFNHHPSCRDDGDGGAGVVVEEDDLELARRYPDISITDIPSLT